MSLRTVKCVSVLVVLVVCGLLAKGDMPGGAANTIVFTGGTPSAGGAKGEIATAVKWDGLQLALAKVEISLYETVNGKESLLASKEKAATVSPGTWAYQFTGLTSGKVVTRGYARTMDNTQMAPTITDVSTGAISVTVP
jgi:hypothetical protein